MSRADAFLLTIAGLALVTWLAVAREWRIGRILARRWKIARPYLSSYITHSPATFIYAGIIAFTTWVLAGSTGRLSNALLRSQSTNLGNLRHHAVDVLVRSAFWSGYSYILPIIAFLALILAPAEFWLGTRRTIVVFAIGHVGTTIITALGIYLAVQLGYASAGIERTIDVGVSYGTFCVAGVLTYRLQPPWRYAWPSALLGTLVIFAAIDTSFSDYGHVVSVLLGLACYPITRTARADERRTVPIYRPWLLEPSHVPPIPPRNAASAESRAIHLSAHLEAAEPPLTPRSGATEIIALHAPSVTPAPASARRHP